MSYVIKFGEIGDRFYIILKGACSVLIPNSSIVNRDDKLKELQTNLETVKSPFQNEVFYLRLTRANLRRSGFRKENAICSLLRMDFTLLKTLNAKHYGWSRCIMVACADDSATSTLAVAKSFALSRNECFVFQIHACSSGTQVIFSNDLGL